MLNRFMISVAAVTLVAGTGLANAQGNMGRDSGGSAGAAQMQHAQPSGGAMGKDSAAPDKGTVGQSGGAMEKSGAAEKSGGMDKSGTMNKNAADEKAGAAKGEHAQGDKSAQDK